MATLSVHKKDRLQKSCAITSLKTLGGKDGTAAGVTCALCAGSVAGGDYVGLLLGQQSAV